MSNQNVINKNKLVRIGQFGLIILVVALGVRFVNHVGIEQIRSNVKQFGSWAFLVVGGLRLTSVVIPVLPGTAYSILVL